MRRLVGKERRQAIFGQKPKNAKNNTK